MHHFVFFRIKKLCVYSSSLLSCPLRVNSKDKLSPPMCVYKTGKLMDYVKLYNYANVFKKDNHKHPRQMIQLHGEI